MVALFHENKALNRFANIVPCEFGICYNLDGDEESYTPPDDENLIKLSLMESQKDCQRSYINASYIAVSTGLMVVLKTTNTCIVSLSGILGTKEVYSHSRLRTSFKECLIAHL